MSTFQLGETLETVIAIYNKNNELVDVATCTITINDSEGATLQDEVDMTWVSLGVYSHDAQLPAESVGPLGEYKIRITMTGTSGKVSIATDTIKVVSSL